MKKTIAKAVLTALLLTPLVSALPAYAVAPNWDATGNYVINFNYLGNNYAHDMSLSQDNMGNLTGSGGHPAGGSHQYHWVLTSGSVSGDTIDFHANYTASADAVVPLTTMHVMGTIASDGSMSGTWSDNYQGQSRSGTWATTSGHATMLPETVKVTIVKYIDGSMATAQSAQSMSFPMTATWNADNIGAGTGQYSLSPNGFNGDPTPYQAITSAMTRGADYTTSEMTGGSVVGTSCQTGQPYMLEGYKWGKTLAEAQQSSLSMTPPAFTDLMHDKFVIVMNKNCAGSNQGGQIGGSVNDNNGVLKVDSITVVKGNATADGTYANGWKYIFHITDPNNEPKLSMKFSDWMSGSNTIPVANNMRISSMQADNGGATITLTAANTYSTPPLNMVTDLNTTMAGRQVEVVVEVKIPPGTAGGSYTTTYGVKTTN